MICKLFVGEGGYVVLKGVFVVVVKYLVCEFGVYGICVNSIYMGWMWGVLM